MIKKISCLFMLLLTLVACDKGDGTPQNSITLKNGASAEHTFFADVMQPTSAIEFTADHSWVARVNTVAPKAEASNLDWLTLSKYSGEAGDHRISLTLKENLSGVVRKAIVSIACGDATLEITIEQKAETATGEINTPVAITDEAFKAYLIENFDLNDNSSLEISEMRLISVISTDNAQIKSLEGIEHCKNLTSLEIYNTPISVFDFSFAPRFESLIIGSPTASNIKITADALAELKLMNVPKTTAVDAYPSEKLSSIDLFKTDLTSIDVLRFANLDHLSIDEVSVAKFDLSKLSKLKSVNLSKVDIAELVISNPELTTFTLWDSKIPSIDLSSATNLGMTYFGGINYIEHLNIGAVDLPLNEENSWGKFQLELRTSANSLTIVSEKLAYITVEGGSLSDIDVKGCKSLVSLIVNGVVKSEIESATKITSADKMTELIIQKSRINNLDLTACPSLDSFMLNFHFADNFVLKANEKLTAIHISDGTWVGTESMRSTTQAIELVGCKNVQTIECTGIATLQSLNATSCVKLKSIDVRNNKLQNLTIPATATLETLRCDNNEITALDLTGCTELYNVICTNNKLVELDVSMCDLRDIRTYPYPSYFPLECKMSSLKKVYLKQGAQINGISYRHNSDYIDDATTVEFK